MDVNFETKHKGGKAGKDEWLTPPEIIKDLGPFDLDPCAPITRPWDTAKNHFNILDNGLLRPWEGFVWLNPPYGKEAASWLQRLKGHNNGIALIFARTETNNFFTNIWEDASGLLFIKGRLRFYHVTGERGGPAGAPSVLVSYGPEGLERLKKSTIKGKLITP